jgi:hypothetical protein
LEGRKDVRESAVYLSWLFMRIGCVHLNASSSDDEISRAAELVSQRIDADVVEPSLVENPSSAISVR